MESPLAVERLGGPNYDRVQRPWSLNSGPGLVKLWRKNINNGKNSLEYLSSVRVRKFLFINIPPGTPIPFRHLGMLPRPDLNKSE